MEKAQNKPSYRLLIIDVFAFIFLGLCAAIIQLNAWKTTGVNDSLLLGLAVPTFTFLLVGIILYLFAEYKYNHLKLKNIFLCFAVIIAISNIIAVIALPNEVMLPNGGETLVITPMFRIYSLLVGFALGLAPFLCFYVIPKKILNRRYMNIILYIVLGMALGTILLSFVVEPQSYAGMFMSHFTDIEKYALHSICGHKNYFAQILMFGMMASILLRIRKKNALWSLAIIPLYLFTLLTYSKVIIVVETLIVVIYLIIRLIMICKRNRDNLVITLLLSGFVVILLPLFITGIVRSESGILFDIKNMFIKFGDSAKTTFESRVIIWTCAFQLLKPYQYIFGFGVTTFGYALHNTYAPVAPAWENIDAIYHSHNAFVEMIGGGGVILLGIYLFIYIYFIYITLKLRKKTPYLSMAALIFTILSLFVSMVEPIYIGGVSGSLYLDMVIVLPIMSEYYLLIDKDECKVRKEIIDQAKTIKKVNFNNKLLSLNKKRLIYEAKYIAYDLNNKIKL